MWEAIAYVSSGVTLAAFFAATAAWLYRRKVVQTERLIMTAPEVDRAPLVERALEAVGIDPRKLTRQHQFEIAMEQIRNRAAQYRTAAAVISLIAVLAALVVAIAVWRGSRSTEADNAIQQIKETTAQLVSTTTKLEDLIDKTDAERRSIADERTVEEAKRAIVEAKRATRTANRRYQVRIDNSPNGCNFELVVEDKNGKYRQLRVLGPSDRPALVVETLRNIAANWPSYDVGALDLLDD